MGQVRSRFCILLVFLGVHVSACASTYNAERKEDLKRRAEFDFHCPTTQLEMIPLSYESNIVASMGVRGCQKQGVYVLRAGTWILNTDDRSMPIAQ